MGGLSNIEMNDRMAGMKKNFWQKIKKPFYCLAPMADVTDIAFRTMLTKYSKNTNNINEIVLWTEFVSADGLCSVGKNKLLPNLKFSKKERPVVAQIFGAKPENIKKASAMIARLGFDGLDLNMGCPDKSVIKQGAGSALIKNPSLAREIIRAAIQGVKSTGKNIPVSVKTRVGFNKEEIDTWIPEIIQEGISAITIHARTKKEMSKVPADWNYVKRVVEIVKENSKNILVIGNGDIKNLEEAQKRIKETGCDGVMIGRGTFGNPWIFSGKNYEAISLKQKIKALIEHIKVFDKQLLKTGIKKYPVMKKHFKAYISGFDGAKELRNELMNTGKPIESIQILSDFQKTLK